VPRGIMVVHSAPSDPAREDEYNDWYSNTHLPQICQVPGITGARRYRLRDGAPGAHPYVAIYDLDADDLDAPVKELRARFASGEIGLSDVLQLDPPPTVAIYELAGE
jgi:hypothetical protein